MADLSGLLKKAFPFITTAATAFGGPAGAAAANLLGSALGVKKQNPSVDELAAAYVNATPEQLAAAQKEEHEFAEKMKAMGFENEKEMETIAAGDRANARNREIQVRDHTPEIGFYLLLAATLIVLVCLFRYAVPPENKAIVYSMAGGLITLTTMAGTYFYGSTRQSERHTELLAQAEAINPAADK